MKRIVRFDVPGRPATFATAHEAAWRASVTEALSAALAREPIRAASRARFMLRLAFRNPRPANSNERWDLDNLIKPTMDALGEVLGLRTWAGPDQVADDTVDRIEAEKRPVTDGEPPGATIEVWADATIAAATLPQEGVSRPVEVVETWDRIINDFLDGADAAPSAMREWLAGYRGQGRGEVVLDAFPEPWVGSFDRSTCQGVMLGLNPGQAHLDFQARNGTFADEIRSMGAFSKWAATWPYLRDPWVSQKGPNRYHRSRLRFLRDWTADSALDTAAMVNVEMYPWHSTSVTAVMRPDPGIIREWVLNPVRELDAPVFAFGAPWLDLLPRLGLAEVDRLGRGGRPYRSAVATRTVAVFDLDGRPLIAEKHSGSAGPPNTHETLLLQEALGL